jgi:DNA-binding IclR family transcriptional regulator
MAKWSFLTNHARALLCIAHNPGVRLRDIASALDITERSAFAIVSELADAGYLIKEKDGRRNHYDVQGHLPLRGTIGRDRTISEVLDILVEASAHQHSATDQPEASATPPRRTWWRWRIRVAERRDRWVIDQSVA